MDDLTIEPAAERREDSRPADGEFGVPLFDALDPAERAVVEPPATMRPGSIGVRYRLKRRFRTYDAIACVPTHLAQVSACDTAEVGDGERMHGGHSYLPVLVGGIPVDASNENLDAIIRAAVPTDVIVAPHPAVAERALHDAFQPSLDRYLLIDDEVWIRA